jgi:tRNA (guanosine-2'-O-)-methyltransferase
VFPFARTVVDGIPAQTALRHLRPLLTPERVEKINKVVEERTFNIVAVLEDIYDRGNASAVMRSAEALGIGLVHSIEPGEKFKESQRASAGADKWVEIKRWKSTQEFIAQIKSEKKQLLVTHLHAASKPISEIDFSKPTAIVFGNEKTGASAELVQAADACILLPMVGFVQSYNISVAAALCFYHIYMDRLRRQGFHGDLNEEEKMILRTHYYMRTQPSSEEYLRELAARGELK